MRMASWLKAIQRHESASKRTREVTIDQAESILRMDTFVDKVAIITGASSGIGAETAVCFAARGARIVITGRRQAGLDETVARCTEKGIDDKKILSVVGDLTDKGDITKIVEAAVDVFGQIDILINNAGSFIHGPFEETLDTDIVQMHNTNTLSVFNMTKAAMPWLLKTRGNIVNVSSIAGHIAVPGALAYAMSKAALGQFTRCLALEYAAKGVRVNSVNPAYIATPMLKSLPIGDTPANMQQIIEKLSLIHPMQRVGQTTEVAAAIIFLASNQSSFTTGALLPVCGGGESCIQGAIGNV